MHGPINISACIFLSLIEYAGDDTALTVSVVGNSTFFCSEGGKQQVTPILW